jgi:hypothetical protein
LEQGQFRLILALIKVPTSIIITKMKHITFFFLLFLSYSAFSQELNCQIEINRQQLSGTNEQFFQSMHNDIYEFMNNKRWTEHVYNNDERIECKFQITLSSQVGNKFTGTLSVQSRRPIYNSTYNTVMLNYQEKKEDFIFDYIEKQTLDFNESSFSSNLTAVLAFYAYVIIGLDYDSFSLNGGGAYFQKAMNIVNNAQSANEPGWKAYENLKNRYWLIENLTNEIYKPMRDCSYSYHRLGLDVLSEKPEAGRSEIVNAIEELKKVHNRKPSSFLMNLFFIAKGDEIINIFSEGFADEKSKVATILKEVDPANLTKYEAMTKSSSN